MYIEKSCNNAVAGFFVVPILTLLSVVRRLHSGVLQRLTTVTNLGYEDLLEYVRIRTLPAEGWW